MAKRKPSQPAPVKKIENLMFDGWKWAALFVALTPLVVALFLKMKGN